MKKMIGLISSLLLLFTIGCKSVDIKDGMIPKEYLEIAKSFTGDYFGRFSGTMGTLTFELEGQKMLVSFKDKNGDTDLLDPRCHSEIGDLTKIRGREKDGEFTLTGAIFEFDPVDCDNFIMGRSLDISVSEKNGQTRLSVRILERQEWYQDCHYSGGGKGGVHKVCQTKSRPIYIQGRFEKQ